MSGAVPHGQPRNIRQSRLSSQCAFGLFSLSERGCVRCECDAFLKWGYRLGYYHHRHHLGVARCERQESVGVVLPRTQCVLAGGNALRSISLHGRFVSILITLITRDSSMINIPQRWRTITTFSRLLSLRARLSATKNARS